MANIPWASVTVLYSIPLHLYTQSVHSLTTTPSNGLLAQVMLPVTIPVVGSSVAVGTVVSVGMRVGVKVFVGVYVAVTVGEGVEIGVGTNMAASGGIPQTANAITVTNTTRPMIHAGRIFPSRLSGFCFSRGSFFCSRAFPSSAGSCPACGLVCNGGGFYSSCSMAGGSGFCISGGSCTAGTTAAGSTLFAASPGLIPRAFRMTGK